MDGIRRDWCRPAILQLQFNAANQPTQLTYPSGRVINLGHDSKGRLTSIGSFLTGVTYDGIGQLTGTSLGNGVNEIYGYDANRLQLTSQTATKSGGPTNGLMNLTYGYDASAGQMGAGSTPGNAGQHDQLSIQHHKPDHSDYLSVRASREREL